MVFMKVLESPPDFLSRDDCQALLTHIVGLTQGGGETSLSLVSRWRAGLEWTRNRVKTAEDVRTIELTIGRTIRGASGSVTTARLDDDGLRDAIAMAETTLRMSAEDPDPSPPSFVDAPMTQPALWSEATYRLSSDDRAVLVDRLIAPTAWAGLSSFGAFRTMADGTASLDTLGLFRYYATTTVECSMTVRDPARSASGWAGVSHFDLGKVDPAALAAKALDKCRRSANPRAIEPGRYDVVLEPQAVADLIACFGDSPGILSRPGSEIGLGPFAGATSGWTKIGERVMDPRLTLRSDPTDPDGGFVPFERFSGTPYQAVDWIGHGVLRELSYPMNYALAKLNRAAALLNPRSFTLRPVNEMPLQTIDEMVTSTERGLLVTRLSEVRLLDLSSALCTGYTRDGVWLIERGAISKPVKNFRFTESPLFSLNNVEAIGTPVRVFTPGVAYVVPAIRVKDFSMTSLADVV